MIITILLLTNLAAFWAWSMAESSAKYYKKQSRGRFMELEAKELEMSKLLANLKQSQNINKEMAANQDRMANAYLKLHEKLKAK
jgi:hypothetical protein